MSGELGMRYTEFGGGWPIYDDITASTSAFSDNCPFVSDEIPVSVTECPILTFVKQCVEDYTSQGAMVSAQIKGISKMRRVAQGTAFAWTYAVDDGYVTHFRGSYDDMMTTADIIRKRYCPRQCSLHEIVDNALKGLK
jgi:hypothetical protein